MIGKHNLAVVRPTVQDIMSQASVYGATIPLVIGTVLQPPLLIWLNGIHKTSGKKSSKKGQQTFQGQIDLMLGHNPIVTTLRCWQNGPSVGLGCGYNKVSTGNVNSYTVVDSLFYQIIGVTATIPYSYSFNDYGANAPSSGSGSYEIPLWNAAIHGPDPTNPSGYRWAPYTYYNLPGSATVSQMHVPGATAINVYYANLASSGWGAGQIPIAKVLRLAFESSLGDGSEYTSPNDYSGQRIIYPMFAGVGSSTFDLGQGVAPQMKIETMGNCALYPDGIGTAIGTNQPGPPWPSADADFADMIELVLKQGLGQAALLSTGVGTATAQSQIQTGCSSFNFPGTVQKKVWAPSFGSFSGTVTLDKPTTSGNILVAMVAGPPSVLTMGISDSSSGAWSAVSNHNGVGFWYKVIGSSVAADPVVFTNVDPTADVIVLEIAGCDSVAGASISSAAGPSLPTGTISTTQYPGVPAYVLAWVFPDTSGDTGSGNYSMWNQCVPSKGQGGNQYGIGPANSYVVQRTLNQPTTVKFTGDVATGSWTVVMLVLQNSVAPAVPKPFADLLDPVTLQQCRLQCRANGLWGSLLMNSQRKASDWLTEIYECAITWPVWSGFKLKSVPLSEVSAFGNGAVYTSPTASGPLFNLTLADAVGEPGKPWINIERKAVTDRQDLQRVQFPDRDNQYRSGTISQPDQMSLTLNGLRYATPKRYEMIPHASIAKSVLAINVRQSTQLVRTYKFTLQARYRLLEAGDLVTLTDQILGFNQLPVRMRSVVEDDKYQLQCEAEDFIYGLHDPKPLPVTPSSASTIAPQTQYVPAAVNTPVFIEPPPVMTGVVGNQLKIVVSDSDAQYGGCQAYVSVDGGSSYTPLVGTGGSSLILGNGTTGTIASNWASSLDPDTTNDLPVDLTESLGSLAQYSVNQEDQFLFPCYVAGGGGLYPYELMTYAVATLTSANHYTLKAAGVGNKLRRAVFGTWAGANSPNTGPAHTSGARFAFVDPSGTGVMTVNVPNSWIGKTLFFKFVQFNLFSSGQGTLAAAAAYSYTVTGNQNGPGGGSGGSGGAGGSSYTISPSNPLSQTSTTNIHMANVTASWTPSGLQTFYAARNFTIPAPSTPLTYYVTVYDPNQTGDTGASATLTGICANSAAAANVGLPGYVYMGSIVATSAGTGGGGSSGGSNPSGATAIQIPIPSTTRGDFSIAHGLGVVPKDVDIKLQSNGIIRFQSPTMWDATNVYLNASTDGLTGTLVIEL